MPRVSPADGARIVARLLLPKLAEGVVVRRPAAMAAARRLGSDRRSVHLLEGLRTRYGPGPLRLSVPGRTVALLLEPADVARVLAGTGEAFTQATPEKRASLAQFQPHGVLITEGPLREERRRVNEEALDSGRPLHPSAERFTRVVREEAAAPASSRHFGWDDVAAPEGPWWRSVRRIVFGDAAADATGLTARLDELRTAANWSVLAPRRRARRAEFLRRVHRLAEAADEASLAGHLRGGDEADPYGQIPHWLFAFDAGAAVTLRTLALLTTHPEQLAHVREELTAGTPGLPWLRRCVLDASRLWPTTPLLLRESHEATHWRGETLGPGTGLVVFTPYFHRGEPAGDLADRFAPEAWADGTAGEHPGFVPFSAGPARCPGRDVLLLVASAWLAALLSSRDWRLTRAAGRGGVRSEDLDPEAPLPATLNHFALRFTAA